MYDSVRFSVLSFLHASIDFKCTTKISYLPTCLCTKLFSNDQVAQASLLSVHCSNPGAQQRVAQNEGTEQVRAKI